MPIEVVTYTRSSIPFSEHVFEQITQITHTFEPKVKGKIIIYVVGEKRIRSLNKQYRGKDRVTDVLSFADGGDRLFPIVEQSRSLGELFLCPHHIKAQARVFKVSFKNELARMFIHGLLHLAGHDHETPGEARQMFQLQEKILEKIYKKILKEPVTSYPVKLIEKRHMVYLD